MRSPSFNRIAPYYQFMERAAFGNHLERARQAPLRALERVPRSALLLGDGDGRFARALLARFPELHLDTIDSSKRMLSLSRKGLMDAGHSESAVRFIHADITQFDFHHNRYDLIGLNFILDCFSQEDLDQLLPRIERSLTPNATVLYSDFALPPGPSLARLFARLTVTGLYTAFRAMTGLQTDRLASPNWKRATRCPFRSTQLNGLLVSELREAAS